VLALAVLAAWPGGAPDTARAAPRADPIPVLAYYYIWYEPNSWRRAKIDNPLLGRYASDDQWVMRRHVEWARKAGIDGFIVSWKRTPTLDERLAKLVHIARANRFKLAIIYQGLDHDRHPLPVDRVASDLQAFAARYAQSDVFDIFGAPLVIWSGTWRFTRDAVERVTRPLRDRLLVLASARTNPGYERLAGSVDGNAYYWSSVDPFAHGNYGARLRSMGEDVHRHGGLWIAPAAPGFDARLVGGRITVDRRHGDTLRRELAGAFGSNPDAIGLISWNEFSENSHVEPSERYGTRYLELLAAALGRPPPRIEDFGASDDSSTTGFSYGLPVLVGFAALLVGGVLVTARGDRRRSRRSV
jgi:hypothetical protein